jgi:mRNA interferase MazF
MTGSVEFSEIYLCNFPFTSGTDSKKRPCLVIFDLSEDVLISRIASVSHTTSFDLPIRDWQVAGLLKPSTIRLARLVSIEKGLLIRRLGGLSDFDKEMGETLWGTEMRLRKK